MSVSGATNLSYSTGVPPAFNVIQGNSLSDLDYQATNAMTMMQASDITFFNNVLGSGQVLNGVTSSDFYWNVVRSVSASSGTRSTRYFLNRFLYDLPPNISSDSSVAMDGGPDIGGNSSPIHPPPDDHFPYQSLQMGHNGDVVVLSPDSSLTAGSQTRKFIACVGPR